MVSSSTSIGKRPEPPSPPGKVYLAPQKGALCGTGDACPSLSPKVRLPWDAPCVIARFSFPKRSFAAQRKSGGVRDWIHLLIWTPTLYPLDPIGSEGVAASRHHLFCGGPNVSRNGGASRIEGAAGPAFTRWRSLRGAGTGGHSWVVHCPLSRVQKVLRSWWQMLLPHGCCRRVSHPPPRDPR